MELKHPDDALSTLLGARVYDGDGTRLGRVHDVVASGDRAPVVTALVVRKHRWSRSVEVPWQAVTAIADNRLTATL